MQESCKILAWIGVNTLFKFNDEKDHLKCSFCGKPQEQVRKLVAGPGVYICDECINLSKEIIDNELYLVFQVKETKFKAHWQASDNYAVWQTCGICGDDYSGYMLFPTYKKDEYFCISYQC